MKKFFKNKQGFTLVELIVVIAILGILAGVGTVGYSGYIKKANMAADQQLASGVANVLQLEYYADMDTTGYVILSKDKAPSVEDKTISENLVAALETAFGDLGNLKLKSGDWAISNEMLAAALGATDAVGNSSYVKNSSVGDLLGNVQAVVSAASQALGNYATEDNIMTLLGGVLGDTYMEKAEGYGIVEKKNGELQLKDGTYTVVNGKVQMNQDLQNQLSNMMVFSVAEDMKNVSNEDMANLMMSGIDDSATPEQYRGNTALVLASQYALYKAYAVDCGKEADFNELNNAITAAGKGGNPLRDVEAALAEFKDDNLDNLVKYSMVLDENDDTVYSSAVLNNAAAIPQIMTGVGAVEGNYTTASSLASGNLYTSGGVASDLTSYINVAGMDQAAKEALQQAVTAAGTNALGGMIITVGSSGVNNPTIN